jgi:hypothetical protein
MENKPTNKINVAATLNILAGIIFLLSVFHPFIAGTGIDYVYIPIGVVFLVIGIMGVREKKK